MTLNGRFTNIYLVYIKTKSLQNNDAIEIKLNANVNGLCPSRAISTIAELLVMSRLWSGCRTARRTSYAIITFYARLIATWQTARLSPVFNDRRITSRQVRDVGSNWRRLVSTFCLSLPSLSLSFPSPPLPSLLK